MGRWAGIVGSLLIFSGCVSGDLGWCSNRSPLFTRFGSADARAFGFLKSAERLETSHVGAVGLPSCLVAAYRHIARQRDAAATFKELFEQSEPVGKIYALAGLYETDRAAFERLTVTAQAASPARFEQVDGDVVSGISKHDVFALLQSGELSATLRPR